MATQRPLRDAASTHVLEGVIIASLMVSAVGFVVTHDPPPAPTAGSHDYLQRKVDDALAILYDTPVSDSAYGTNALSVGIMQCLQGDCSYLQTRLNTLLPQGSYYSLHVSNGHGQFAVVETRAPGGEAVSARRLLEPEWSFSMLAPALSTINPSSDPLVMYGLPVFNSNTIHPEGSTLRVTVNGLREGDNSTYKLRTTVNTNAAPASQAHSAPAASLYFVDTLGEPVATQDVTATTIGGGALTNADVPLTMRLEETAGARVPAGTRLTLHVPQGWTASAPAGLNADWSVLENATDKSGGAVGAVVVATLLDDLVLDSVDFTVHAKYLGDANDHYPFVAALSRGAYAKSTLMVQADRHPTVPDYEIPDVFLSAPRPMGATAVTTWTLGVLIPQTAGAALSDRVTVTSIEIAEEAGAPIFASVEAIRAAGGAWTSHGDRLVWEGSALLGHESPLDLSFRVVGSGEGATSVEKSAFVPSVTLDGWQGRLLDEIAPGLYRGAFLPADSTYSGYNSSTKGGLYASHAASSSTTYRTTAIPGSVDYTVGHVLGLHDSLYGSDVSVSDRHVAVGSTVDLAVDVQSLLYQLGPLGYNPTVDLRVYPPWSGGSGATIFETTLLSETTLQDLGGLDALIDTNGDGFPEASSVGHFAQSIDVPRHWLFGPYLVEVEVTWGESLSATVDGVPLSGSLTRSARVYDYFVATPPVVLSPASPVYDVHLVAWMGDWG